MKDLDFKDKKIKKILLIRLRNIGDVLLTVPTIRAFREAYPWTFIAALVNAGTEEMLTGNPLLNEVLVFDPAWKSLPLGQRLKKEMNFLREVRQRRFDLAINLTEGDRGAFLCWASRASEKIGLTKRDGTFWWKKLIYNHGLPIPNGSAHVVDQILEVPHHLGLNIADKRVEIYFSPADKEIIDQLLMKEGVGARDPLVHIHPTSRWLFKCWRDEGMAKVIDELQATGKVRVVLTGGPEKKELDKIERILEHCQTHPLNLAGRTSLKQLAALSRRCLFFIGVDTAPMHIAAAVGTPVIALFGPSGEVSWRPWGPGHVVIKKDLDCRPCGRDGCQGSKRSRCLEEISEEEVLRAAFKFLPKGENPSEFGDP
ncbi:MAG: putative lipopolysaccharide heptosyltransferase III [Deltaproteobacteria bacterium]|nr:putative lipopolysaccharide heptosyltransferase III [Deltaproteobacteria bacterium]